MDPTPPQVQRLGQVPRPRRPGAGAGAGGPPTKKLCGFPLGCLAGWLSLSLFFFVHSFCCFDLVTRHVGDESSRTIKGRRGGAPRKPPIALVDRESVRPDRAGHILATHHSFCFCPSPSPTPSSRQKERQQAGHSLSLVERWKGKLLKNGMIQNLAILIFFTVIQY